MELTENRVLSGIINFILDLIFALILLFSIVMTIIALSSHKSLLGYRFGIVESSSMANSGLEIGDIVFLEKHNSYKAGDIIAFYRAPNLYQSSNYKEEDLDNYPIWIHEVIDIKKDESGKEYYLTKGTSNISDDTYYVPYDFVIGYGHILPPVINKAISFIISVTGIICLIIVPCIIMLIYLTWELIMVITSEPEEKMKLVGRPIKAPNKKKIYLPRKRLIYVSYIPYNKYNLPMPVITEDTKRVLKEITKRNVGGAR